MPDAEQPASRKTAPTSYPCPRCGRPMRIAVVEPDGPEHERRLFECADCKETKTVVVRYR